MKALSWVIQMCWIRQNSYPQLQHPKRDSGNVDNDVGKVQQWYENKTDRVLQPHQPRIRGEKDRGKDRENRGIHRKTMWRQEMGREQNVNISEAVNPVNDEGCGVHKGSPRVIRLVIRIGGSPDLNRRSIDDVVTLKA